MRWTATAEHSCIERAGNSRISGRRKGGSLAAAILEESGFGGRCDTRIGDAQILVQTCVQTQCAALQNSTKTL